MRQELFLVFDYKTTSAPKTWELIAEYLKARGLAENIYEMLDEKVPFERVCDYLERRGKNHFEIKGMRLSFCLSVIGGSAIDVVRVTGNQMMDWNSWVDCLKKAGNFVHAFVVDQDYDFWQNAQDRLEYESKGRSFQGLPTISNGLPFPLERTVIDTSSNPGRRVLRTGFIEAVGSQMWFGMKFWDLTGKDKAKMEGEGIKVEEIDGISRILLGEPFTSVSDRSVQDTLRRALFKK